MKKLEKLAFCPLKVAPFFINNSVVISLGCGKN